jgi:hypothetical protein
MRTDYECGAQRVFGKVVTCCYEPRGGVLLEQEELQKLYMPDAWLLYVQTGHDMVQRSTDAIMPTWGYDLDEWRALRAEAERVLRRGPYLPPSLPR